MTYQSIYLRARRTERLPARPGAAGLYQFPELTLEEQGWSKLLPGQALVKVFSVSICGTDIHAMQIDADGYSRSSVPATRWETGIQFGHEFSGRIIATGPGVTGFAAGDYVTGDSLVPCRRDDCRLCRTGRWNACPRAYLLGFQTNGVFGEYAVLPAASLHSIDPLIRRFGIAAGLRFATLAEPLGVALHAYRQARQWLPMETPAVLVLGGGPIGLLFALQARLSGSANVAIVEPNPSRAAHAHALADHVLHPDQFDAGTNQEVFGIGPDLVFDACGQAKMSRTLRLLAPGGVIVTMARTGQDVQVETDSLITNGQAILGTRGHVGQVARAVQLLASSEFDPGMFITRDLDDMAQLRAMLCEPSQLGDELKVSCRISSGHRPAYC